VTALSPQRIVVEAAPRLAEVAAEWLAVAVEAVLRDRGSCSVALSGGETARPLYERLAGEPYASRISWRDLDIYFGDERAVPPGDPASNYGMATASLLVRVPIAPARVHRMEAERADRDAAARDYERILPGRLDVLLLGMGADGHTASLFPGSAAVQERARRVLPIVGPKPPAERLTITPPVIETARRVAVLVSGTNKAAMVARALQGPVTPRDLPVQFALGGTWFLDREAAAGLEGAEP
jgi:6-phosphogluconolactonase